MTGRSLVPAVVRLILWALVSVATIAVVSAPTGCGGQAAAEGNAVVADTSFMADIAHNVAGDRLSVSSLLPVGADPHSFQPTPRDATRIARSKAVVINITGFEPLVDDLIRGAGGKGVKVIEAAAGIAGAATDPHVWLDPTAVISFTDNLAKGFTVIDPDGAAAYRANASAYAAKLRELDAWIVGQVAAIPAERRLLVTNHESLGYFAKRYGFRIVGTVSPSVSGEGSPSARQLAELIANIKATHAPAVFVEIGGNNTLAKEVGRETGAKVVTDLYIHSLGKNASTYMEMMRWNVRLIVGALL